MTEKFIEELAKQWLASWPSPVVPQKAVGDFTGGLMAKQTLVNLCNQGRGPEGKFYIRGQACWKKEVMLAWLLDTLTIEYQGADIKSKAPNARKGVVRLVESTDSVAAMP